MVMEYVSGGELFDYICKHGRVSASTMSAPNSYVGRERCSEVKRLLKGRQLRLRPKIEVASQQSYLESLVLTLHISCVPFFCNVP